MASVWILQNSAGKTICPYADESGFVIRDFQNGRTTSDALCFASEQEANEWHDGHLLDENQDYEGPEFFAYEYEDGARIDGK